MSSDAEPPSRRIPTLVSYCQRVAATHVNSISSFGDGAFRYDLVKPILENCTPEALLRFESLSPYLRESTEEIWKNKVKRQYPLYAAGEPESWRRQFFILRREEEAKLEAAGSRIRSRRNEEAEQKKGREIKLTNKVPNEGRRRWNSGPAPPKSLFDKTRLEASKIQRMVQPTPHVRPSFSGPPAKKPRILPPLPSAKPPGGTTVQLSRHVVVRTTQRKVTTSPSMSRSTSVSSTTTSRSISTSSSRTSSSASSAATSRSPSASSADSPVEKPLCAPFFESRGKNTTATWSRLPTVSEVTSKSPSPPKKASLLFIPKQTQRSIQLAPRMVSSK